VLNAVIFGGIAFFFLSLLHVSGPRFWCIVVAVIVVAYVFYSWLSGRKLRQERT
jgi:Ca2+/Na+ antiporter